MGAWAESPLILVVSQPPPRPLQDVQVEAGSQRALLLLVRLRGEVRVAIFDLQAKKGVKNGLWDQDVYSPGHLNMHIDKNRKLRQNRWFFLGGA